MVLILRGNWRQRSKEASHHYFPASGPGRANADALASCHHQWTWRRMGPGKRAGEKEEVEMRQRGQGPLEMCGCGPVVT